MVTMENAICRLLALSLLFGACLGASVTPNEDPVNCGYDSCHKEKEGMINAHVICHTHTDPGWLLTADQYYYRFVQWILYSVMPSLESNPDRRFIYVEMSFFTRWWNSGLDESIKKRVRKLVDQGRLEFILGGWVMNDEAAAHYTAIINQHKRGFEFLRETFGKCGRTKIGWQIDPFGHSREQASLFAQFGFDGLFFARLDYQDRAHRIKEKQMEFLWRGSPNNLGGSSSLFTGILPHHYLYPDGLTFDVSQVYGARVPNPFINDDPKLFDYNVDVMVDRFIDAVNEYRNKGYRTNRAIVTMGSDYNYVDAHLNFMEIDKIIKYVNARQANGSKINAIYSTPSCYLKAVNNDKLSWSTKEDDFFPYAHRPHSYWTGYFTSRPSQKYFIRKSNAYNQAAKKLATLARVNNTKGSWDTLYALENAISVNQHHDSVTGTEKQVVAYDFVERISGPLEKSKEVVNEAYRNIIPKSGSSLPEQVICKYSNVSVCSLTQSKDQFEVTLFNALATPRKFDLSIPVEGSSYQVFDSNGKTEIVSDVNSVMPSVSGIRPKGMKPSKNELVFTTSAVPGMGFKTFFVKKNSSESLNFKSERKQKLPTDAFFIEGNFYRVNFDQNGAIASVHNKLEDITTKFTQNFIYYDPYYGSNNPDYEQSAGAYIMRPSSPRPEVIGLTKVNKVVKGKTVQEVRQEFSNWITQVVRVDKESPAIEMEWTVGPVPVSSMHGKEVMTRYNIPGWGNKGVFYTDANGREVLKRKLNYRPTWPVENDEPVAGNYYPLTSLIYTKSGDGKNSFGVLLDRSEGGTSLNDGDIELNLHRRLLHDDSLGVGEPLSEPGLDGKGLVVRGKHRLIFGSVDFFARHSRLEALNTFQQPLVTFSSSGLSPLKYISKYNTEFTGLATGAKLPNQVHILNFERFRNSGPFPSPAGTTPYLVRFEHVFEKNEDSNLSEPVSFDMKNIFKGFTVDSAHELSLGANAGVEDISRLVWNTESGKTPSGLQRGLTGTVVSLKPMQITTIQVNFKV